jgi:Fic family protein
MLIPPKYRLTPKIVELLQSIEASREVIDSITIPPEIESNIRRQSILKSSLFSARIEGNDLTLADLANTPSDKQKKVEVYNINKAINHLRSQSKLDISLNQIIEIHKIVLDGLSSNAGKVRKESSAIFNSAGIAVYMPPPAGLISSHLIRLVKYINAKSEKFIPIKASLAHFNFEKIHPFLDGNGRTGRVLVQKIMFNYGYGMKGLLSLEEYLDNHRSEYYRALEEPEKDCTDYLIFMLQAISETAKNAKETVLQKQHVEVEDYLLPRRAEIYRIIKDHRTVNFDQIRRRFMAVNERALRYDLKHLQDKQLIKKLGSTKGVYYELVNKIKS